MAVGSPPRSGDKAPDFTLPSTSGSEVTLSSLQGTSNVLLAFFPLAFTGVCTAEMCDFSHDVAAFDAVHATVLGISVDSIPTLTEFKAKHVIGIELLSDFKRDVCRQYGTLLEEPFLSRRAYFVIDKHGTVRWTHIEVDLGHKQDNAELLKQLRSLE